MVTDTLLEYHSSFDAEDFARVRSLVPAWADKLGKALPRTSRARLRDARLLPKHG